jgi:hypothetical protein
MSLPPIISNLPFFKLFRSNNQDGKVESAKSAPAQASAGQSGDSVSAGGDVTVQISEAAQQKLAAQGAKDAADARKLTDDTKVLLEREQVSLGLDPNFS